MNRRTFLEQTSLTLGGAATGLWANGCVGAGSANPQRSASPAARSGPSVAIIADPSDPVAAAAPASWAIAQLRDSLMARGIAVKSYQRPEQAGANAFGIIAAGGGHPLARQILGEARLSLPQGPESLGLVSGKTGRHSLLLSCGSDARGLTYALLELADAVELSDEPMVALTRPRRTVERPANVIRSIARPFVSEVEDKPWFHDPAFWERYLTMLAAQRFNRFSLTLGIGYDFTSNIRDAYFHFAYPFLVSVPGYDVRAVGLPEAERERNLATLRWISEAARRRGLQFQLGLWTHAYHWTDSPSVNYTIEGLGPANHAAYCREALRLLLQACPAITGLTIRIHGESGVAEGSYDFWKTVFDGIAQCGRVVEIDMHAKGMDQRMIDVALATGMPVTVSPKYWAEHMGLPYHQAAIRELEMPPRESRDQGFFAKSSGSRRFLRYGYGDLLAEDRRYGVLHRIWPGTQRLLLWGDPVMAAGYGRASSFCGSLGVELCEPLAFKGRKGSGLPGGRDAYADAALKPAGGDWEKYLYTYRLWGRLLYNPQAEPDTWRRFLRRQYGPSAQAAEAALSQASRILPLITTAHDPSGANVLYWPEIYTNMSIVDATKPHPYGDSPSPKRFGTVSPLDPELFSRIDDFAGEMLEGTRGPKYSPLEVAQWLQTCADTAMASLADAEAREGSQRSPALRRLAADVAIQSGLGGFFAWKLRAGVLYALHERSRELSFLTEALQAYRAARVAWAELSAGPGTVYVADITFGWDANLRGHWRNRLPAIDEDIAAMERLWERAKAVSDAVPGQPAESVKRVLREALSPSRRPDLAIEHTPPSGFAPGAPLVIEVRFAPGEREGRPSAVRLHYRRVNQAERWRTEDMRQQGQGFGATIAADYTRSPYPLQYYFELRDAGGQSRLYPGFNPTLDNQPYFVVRRTSPRPGVG